MTWTLSRDRRTVSTATHAAIRGRLSAGDTKINGNLAVKGNITGKIDVSNITGLLGEGFSLKFPEVANNLAKLEIEGVQINDPVVIITGPGYEIERVAGFHADGRPFDQPGSSMVHPLVFDTQGADRDKIKQYFDQYLGNPAVGRRPMSLIIFSRNQNEFMRWNFFEFIPDKHEPSIDGRTRFKMTPFMSVNLKSKIECMGLPQPQVGVVTNPDNKVEIAGVTELFPQVECDDAKRILTLTYRFDEEVTRGDINMWVTTIMKFGVGEIRDLSVIELDNGIEVSRRNYFGCFPIKYEQFSGFALADKLQSRVTLSYNSWEDG